MSDSLAKLTKALRLNAAEAAFLSPLDEPARQALLRDVERAGDTHARDIRQRMEDALSHIPLLLRGPIRKLFGV